MEKVISFIILIIFTNFLFGQESNAQLFKGIINNKIPITLYLESKENECTSELDYQGMYKYDNSKDWIQLEITKNKKEQFIFTEYNFTGVLILQKSNIGFQGVWISPDTKKQYKVQLKKVKLKELDKQFYKEIKENVNYLNYDC